jgi:hypothetical protein
MIFLEKDHLYKDGEVSYTSVSHVIDSLKKKKNWNLIRKKYAQKVGKTPEEVQTE